MKSTAGFSLVELMVTITIVAIMFGLGIPSMKYVTTNYRISSEINNLVGAMQFARQEAIKEGNPVSVCVSSNGTSCVTNTTSWNKGWIVFTDLNNDATVDAAGDTIWRYTPAFTSTDQFSIVDNPVSAVTFNREGFAALTAARTTLLLHDSTYNAAYTRCLQIQMVGLMQVLTKGKYNCT